MTRKALMACLLFCAPVAANAFPINFSLTVDNVDSGDLGFVGSELGSMSFDFAVDSTAFAGGNTTVNGIAADISFSSASFSFSVSSFVGPVSKATIVENTATREIVTYTANPLFVNTIGFQFVLTTGWPEGLIPLEPGYLPVETTSFSSLRIRDFATVDSRYGDVTGTASAKVPEPAALALLGLGLFGVALRRRAR